MNGGMIFSKNITALSDGSLKFFVAKRLKPPGTSFTPHSTDQHVAFNVHYPFERQHASLVLLSEWGCIRVSAKSAVILWKA